MNPYRSALQKLLATVDAEAFPALERHQSSHPNLRAAAELARAILQQDDATGPIVGWYDPAGDQLISAKQMQSLQEAQGLPGQRLALKYSVPLTAVDPSATADAARWRLMWTEGLPVTFRGVEYESKADCDAAMDAALYGRAFARSS